MNKFVSIKLAINTARNNHEITEKINALFENSFFDTLIKRIEIIDIPDSSNEPKKTDSNQEA